MLVWNRTLSKMMSLHDCGVDWFMVIDEFESKVYTGWKWIVNVMHDVWDMFVNDMEWW